MVGAPLSMGRRDGLPAVPTQKWIIRGGSVIELVFIRAGDYVGRRGDL
ncbi:hypothetical protein [Paenibacillus odorifer]|nr:hypothetical protein [Paenibacillus odorifer]